MERLRGQVILNTRPAHQLAGLTLLLRQEAAEVLEFPAIEIVGPSESDFHRQLAQTIDSYDLLLFVSRNAVDGAFNYIDGAALKPSMRFGVIGAATREALAGHVTAAEDQLIESEPYNSEALLATDELNRVDGKRILIFRGQEGRNLLGDELADRGADVDYCEVYRRALPDCDPEDFNRLTGSIWPTLVVLTSNEGMHNLLQLVDAAARRQLCATPWLLISERMRESALKLGHNADIVIARRASDEGIFQTICAWVEQH